MARAVSCCVAVAVALALAACPVPTSFVLEVRVQGGGTTRPAPGTHVFTAGRSVPVEAVPERGFTFRGWTGDAEGKGNPATLTMDADREVTALFDAAGAATCALTIEVVGAGATEPAAGTHLVPAGAVAEVRAVASSGATFAGWSGAATGTSNPVTVAMDGDRVLRASFSSVSTRHALTIAVVGRGATTPAAGVHSYAAGEVVEVTATASPGATFSGWSGAASGASPRVTVTMDAARTLTATFTDGSGFQPCPGDGTACKLMPLGDSITDGVPVPGGYRVELFRLAGAARKALTFVGAQSNGPGTVDGRQFPQRHEGHSGYTIDSVGGRAGIHPLVQGALTTHRPHVVLLMIGTNDVAGGLELATAPDRLGLLLDRITTTSPDALVVVARIVPTTNDAVNAAVRTYNDGVAAAVRRRSDAGKHLLLVDMYGAFTANPRFKTEWMADWLHPTAEGYAEMARVWYAAIERFLPAAP